MIVEYIVYDMTTGVQVKFPVEDDQQRARHQAEQYAARMAQENPGIRYYVETVRNNRS